MSETIPVEIPDCASAATEQPLARLWPLLLINFLAMAGGYAFIAVAGPMARLMGMQAWQVGVIISLVGLVWMLSAKRWGRYVDQAGRRQTLRLCIVGFTLAYTLMALYVWWVLKLSGDANRYLLYSILVLLLCRAMMGAFYAGIPVAATAWIADHYTFQHRAGVLAKFGASGAIGMVLAPPLAGWIAQYHLPAALLVFAVSGIVSLLAIGSLSIQQSERAVQVPKFSLKASDPRLKNLLASNFICFAVVIIANSCLGFYLIDQLQLSAIQSATITGSALGAAGVALVLAQTLMAKLRQLSSLTSLRGGVVLAALGFASCLLLSPAQAQWVCLSYFIAGLGLGLAFPSVSALATNAVEQSEQGACAGLMSACQGMAMMLAPAMGTLIYEKWPQAPFILNTIFLLAVFLLMSARTSVKASASLPE